MYIKQANLFEFSSSFNNFYYFENSLISNVNIGYVSIFLNSDFWSIKKDLENDIQRIFINGKGIAFQTTAVVIDSNKQFIYIGVLPDYCDEDEEGFKPMVEDKSVLEHFQENLLDNVRLTKDNFFYILRTWKKYLEEKPSFLLLYQNENDWFDILPFQSKEEMDQFIKEHTPITN